MHKGFSFRLYPTPSQAATLGQWVGVTRLVYNLALEQRRDFWRQYRAQTGKHLTWFQQSAEVTDLRRDFDFIGAVPRTCMVQALRDLDKAFSSFFAGRADFPTWRRAGLRDSARLQWKDVGHRNLNRRWAEIRLPRLGWVRYRRSRDVAGNPANVTIKRSGGRWSLAIVAELGPSAGSRLEATVGVDRGVETTLALSNGDRICLPDAGALETRLRVGQRVLARRKIGSARRNKQRKLVAGVAAKIARVRSHHLHVASTDIARRFGVVAIERLNVRAMTVSAKGTLAEPGRNVRQKAGLNRSILAQGWSIFAAQLDYKLEAAGGRLIYVPAAYTSQTCAECGVVDARSRKSQAVFECVACGHRDHADTNAARNIQRGSTAFVEGGQLGRPVEARTSTVSPSEPAFAGDADLSSPQHLRALPTSAHLDNGEA